MKLPFGTYLIPVLIVTLATVLSIVVSEKVPFASMGERWLADYRIATLLPAEAQDQDIIIATINEDTLKQFPYRSPVDRAFLAKLIQTLEKDEVRAIGIDILFDQPSEPEKDAQLKQVLLEAPIPVVVSIAEATEGLNAEQVAYLNDFVPAGLRGYANLAKDPYDGTVRDAFPGRADSNGSFIPGFPFALAAKLGKSMRPNAPLEIAWHGKPSADGTAFKRLPAHVIPLLPKAWLKNKIVLIGADLTLTDRHRSPFSTTERGINALLPGIDFHAHVLAQLLEDRKAPSPALPIMVLVVVIAAGIGVALAYLPWGLLAKMGMGFVATVGVWVAVFVIYQKLGLMLPIVAPTLALAGTLWATDLHTSRQDREQKKFIKAAFAKYVSPDVVDQLLKEPDSLKLGGSEREISILATDIAGFTTTSEAAGAEVMGPLLNQYLGGVSDIVFSEHGTIVDFIGDAVLAIFGAPVFDPNHRERAIACAHKIDAFSNHFRSTGLPPQFKWGVTRIGINAGTVMIGNFGGGSRFKYAAVGDAVNTASRLEGLNKYFSTRIIASEHVLTHAEEPFARPIGDIILKGRTVPLAVYELLDRELAGSSVLVRYNAAYSALKRGEVEVAQQGFAALHQQFPEDGCVNLHLERIKDGSADTLIHMTEK